MGNSKLIAAASNVDQTPQTLRVAFKTASGGTNIPVRFVPSLTLTTGPTAATAFFAVPCKQFATDEQAFAIALKQSGPASAIKLLSRAEVSIAQGRAQVACFCGYVLQRQHVIKKGKTFDVMTGGVLDDRWVLTKFKIFGRVIYDPSNQSTYFDSSAETIFNEHGFGNCLDTPEGPRFAPSFRYGSSSTYSSDGSDEPSPGAATSVARSWRDVDVARYINDIYFLGYCPSPQVDLGNLFVPNCITIADNAWNVFSSQRPIKDLNYTDSTYLEALQDIGRRAGNFDVMVTAVGNFSSQLTWVNMNPVRTSATTLFIPGYTSTSLSDAMNASDLIKGGSITEDVSSWYGGVNIMGDPPAVEQFHSMWSGTGALMLEQAWTTADEQLFKQYCVGNGQGGAQYSDERFAGACLMYPKVYRSYRVSKRADIFKDTKWAGMKIGGLFPKLLPTQLTAENLGQNPSGFQPRPIVVERKMGIDEYKRYQHDISVATPPLPDLGPWVPCFRFDALTLSPDGTEVELEGLRQTGATWYTLVNYSTDPGAPSWPSHSFYDRPAQMRLNLAAQADWPTTGRLDGDPNNVMSQLDGGAPPFVLQIKAGRMAYVDWERTVNSRPVGEGRIDNALAIFTTKATAGDELFSDRPGSALNPDATGRIMRHAAARLIEVNRITLSGELVFKGLNIAIRPSLSAQILGDDTIPLFGVIKTVTFDSTTQETYANFGNNETVSLSDSRGAAQTSLSGSTGAIAAPSTPPPADYNYGDKGDDSWNSSPSSPPAQPSSPPTSTQTDTPSANSPIATPAENQKAMADAQAKTAPPDQPKKELTPVQDQRQQKGMDKAALHKEHRAQVDQDKATQRLGQGTMNGSHDIMHAMFGKPSSGSINGKTDISNAMFGKPSSGSINGKTSLNGAMNGMFDSRQARAHDDKQFADQKSKQNRAQESKNIQAEANVAWDKMMADQRKQQNAPAPVNAADIKKATQNLAIQPSKPASRPSASRGPEPSDE